MKTLLIILGSIAAVVIAGVTALIFYAFTVGAGLDSTSQEYVDEANRAILDPWSEAELLERASPEFLSATDEADVTRLFAMFRTLGDLESYENAEGSAHIQMTPRTGKVVTADYTARAEFGEGEATIETRLIQHDDQWSILAFKINSDRFIEMLSEQAEAVDLPLPEGTAER